MFPGGDSFYINTEHGSGQKLLGDLWEASAAEADWPSNLTAHILDLKFGEIFNFVF